jgi:ankyrin repeat protein
VLDINRSTPLLYAAMRAQLGFIRLLRNFGSTINNVNSLNQVPVIELVRMKNQFSVDQIEGILVDEGLKADFKDANERNALHHLVSVAKNFDNSPEICRKLIEYGVSVNSLDKYGRSPIFYCFIRIEENESSNDDSNDKV